MTDLEVLQWAYKELEYVQPSDDFGQYILFSIEYRIAEQIRGRP